MRRTCDRWILSPHGDFSGALAAMPQAQLDAVLAHESEHVRRRHPLVQWLALLNRALFWFHPVAWWLERHLSVLAEEACDNVVLDRGYDPRAYSEYLIEIARSVERSGVRLNIAGMAMPGSSLPRHIRKILGGDRWHIFRVFEWYVCASLVQSRVPRLPLRRWITCKPTLPSTR
jgi:hypothetical protein